MGALTTRRAVLLATAGGFALAELGNPKGGLDGALCGASMGRGHLLRDGVGAWPTGATSRCDVLVVGSGVAGMAAAWRLAPAGLDVRVVELEPFVGGTSSWGEDGPVPHPWGAHYLPAPNPEARPTLRLLDELGVLRGTTPTGEPRFDPRVLCAAPDERVFYAGAWHPGLAPIEAMPQAERDELARFEAYVDTLRDRRGRDGRPWFQIPVAESSRDPDALALDRLTIAEHLEREGFRGELVRWLVRYATLDDFGGEPETISAWAGLHYFAARKLRGPELEGSHVLVWPEGNGRLVAAMRDRARPAIAKDTLAIAVEERAGGVQAELVDLARGERIRVEARAAIVATPAMVARRIAPSLAGTLPERTSSPWLVANLHVTRPIGFAPAWDSVVYGARGLGYVDASHQLTPPRERTVLTYFRAYGEPDVRAARRALAERSWHALVGDVLDDLRAPHPDLRDVTSRVDVTVWGHAMPRPVPGFLGDRPFDDVAPRAARIAWAHADVQGVALFEESQRAGVLAAERVARAAGVELGATWT